MTVYVDDMEADFEPSHRPGRKYVMCHMIADTDAELHAMADKIGVARRWYQRDHYDIAKSKRALAVAAGAREITMRQLGCMAILRRRGQPIGDPETAVERLMALRAAKGEPERVICCVCGNGCTAHHFMCDESTGGECWCPSCFEKTPCGRGEHGEGCPTGVFEGPAEATA